WMFLVVPQGAVYRPNGTVSHSAWLIVLATISDEHMFHTKFLGRMKTEYVVGSHGSVDQDGLDSVFDKVIEQTLETGIVLFGIPIDDLSNRVPAAHTFTNDLQNFLPRGGVDSVDHLFKLLHTLLEAWISGIPLQISSQEFIDPIKARSSREKVEVEEDFRQVTPLSLVIPNIIRLEVIRLRAFPAPVNLG